MKEEGTLFIVLVICDQCVSAVEDDYSESRVFNSLKAAVQYYENTKRDHYIKSDSVDYIGLYRGKFENEMLIRGDCLMYTGSQWKV